MSDAIAWMVGASLADPGQFQHVGERSHLQTEMGSGRIKADDLAEAIVQFVAEMEQPITMASIARYFGVELHTIQSAVKGLKKNGRVRTYKDKDFVSQRRCWFVELIEGVQ